MNKKFIGTILALTCAATAITGCQTTSTYEPPKVDTINEVHTFDDEEISVARLFEGALETVRYAKYLKVSGKYSYSYSNSFGIVGTDSKIESDAEGPVEYEIFRDDEGNSSSILTGEVGYKHSSFIGIVDPPYTKEDKQASYTYYKTTQGADIKDRFIYYGDDGICGSVDIEKLLLAGLDGKTVKKFSKADDSYYVALEGDFSDARSAFSGSIIGSKKLSSANYYFDCKTHELQSASFGGYSSKEHESNDIHFGSEFESFHFDLIIDSVSNKAVELPKIPEGLSSNGYLNELLMNEREITISEEINNPFDIQNEFYSVASAVWDGVCEMPEEDRNTLPEIKEAMAIAASEYEIDEADCEYALLPSVSMEGGCRGVLIRYALCSEGTIVGYIIIPVTSASEGVMVGEAISLDVKDFAKISMLGRMQFAHDFTPGCQYYVQYMLTDDAELLKEYSYLQELKMSSLTDQAEVVNFPEEDWKMLQKLASEQENARLSALYRYEIREKEDDSYIYKPYYVIDSNMSSQQISDLEDAYSIEMASKAAIDKKLSKADFSIEANAVSWVQIPVE